MALIAVTHDYMNIIGRKREDYGHFSGAATGYFQTRLTWVDEIKIQAPGEATGARTVALFPNDTAASGTQDDPGFVSFTSGSSVTYYYKATGR
jgi:hypothetical protein